MSLFYQYSEILRTKRYKNFFICLLYLNLKSKLADYNSFDHSYYSFALIPFSLSSIFLFFFLFFSFKLTAPNTQEKHGSNTAACEKLVGVTGERVNLASRIYTLFAATLCMRAEGTTKMLHERKGQLAKGYRECSLAKLLLPCI